MSATKTYFSKYDFVKVRVFLNDKHYYVLSRFLICRVLTAAKVAHGDAVRIALDLKKSLVDMDQLDISQAELESRLSQIMQTFHYGADNIALYQMISDFHHLRIPLIILIGGTVSIGKSTLATHLADRLNLPSVVNTNIIFELMSRSLKIAPAFEVPFWMRTSHSAENFETFLAEFHKECRYVEQGLVSDVKKSVREGKSIIIEGVHIRTSFLTLLNEIIIAEAGTGNNSSKTIVVPFLLTLHDESTHCDLIEDWIPRQQLTNVENFHNDVNGCADFLRPFQLIQEQLIKDNTPPVFIQQEFDAGTLERMHGIILKNIDEQQKH